MKEILPLNEVRVEAAILVIEESSELTQALTKYIRFGMTYENRNDLMRELADLSVCLSYLMNQYFINDEMLTPLKEEKVIKLTKYSKYYKGHR